MLTGKIDEITFEHFKEKEELNHHIKEQYETNIKLTETNNQIKIEVKSHENEL